MRRVTLEINCFRPPFPSNVDTDELCGKYGVGRGSVVTVMSPVGRSNETPPPHSPVRECFFFMVLDYFSQHLGEYENVLAALEDLNSSILKAMDKTKKASLVSFHLIWSRM